MIQKLCFVFVLNAMFVLGARFPVNQAKCHYGDSVCFTKVANEIVSNGKTAYPELGLPVLDPLSVARMDIDQGGDSPVNLKINLKNFHIVGLSNTKFMKIDGFKRDYDKAKMELRFKFPVLRIEGPYKLQGKVLVLPVQGEGIANLTFRDTDVTFKILTKKIVKNGKNYMNIEKSKLDFSTTQVYVNFENLFNGNKELGTTTNDFFNQNWRDILKEIRPAVSEALSNVWESLINNVFMNIPYDEIFTN